MDKPTCKICGHRHALSEPHQFTAAEIAKIIGPIEMGRINKAKAAKRRATSPHQHVVDRRIVPPPQPPPPPPEPKRPVGRPKIYPDPVTRNREYMRAYRAKKRAERVNT